MTAFHERELRSQAASNSKIDYVNVSLTGFRRKPHPSMAKLVNVDCGGCEEVKNAHKVPSGRLPDISSEV